MPPNNNLRSVITQCRNFSTRSRGIKVSSSRSSNNVSKEAGRRVVASGGRSKFSVFMSSVAYGNIAFGCWATIEMLEYRRTVARDLEQRGCGAQSMVDDLRNGLLK